MVTSAKSRVKISTYSLISLFLTIIPIVLEFLNQGEPKARIDLEFNTTTAKLKAKVSTPDQEESVSRTHSQLSG